MTAHRKARSNASVRRLSNRALGRWKFGYAIPNFGTLSTIPENPVVELRNVPDAFGRKLEIGIVDASNGLEGAENLENATVRGASDEYRVRFRVKDGRLYARLSSGGMLLIVR